MAHLPIRLECVKGGEIVEHELSVPEGATYTVSPDGTAQLVTTVDLLNPGEAFTVGLTVADAEEGQVRVVARGEFLEVKEIGERANIEELFEIIMPRFLLGNLMLDLYRFSRRRVSEVSSPSRGEAV